MQLQPKAARNYDAAEFRVTNAMTRHLFGQVAYTYSRLRGNYSGLTSTDIADGGVGGRAAKAQILHTAQHLPSKALYAEVSQMPPMEWESVPRRILRLTEDLAKAGANDPEIRLCILMIRGMFEVNYDAAKPRNVAGGWCASPAMHHYELAFRAVAEQGIAAFLLGNIDTAKKQVARAWSLSKVECDPAATVRYASVFGAGLVQVRHYKEALTALDRNRALHTRPSSTTRRSMHLPGCTNMTRRSRLPISPLRASRTQPMKLTSPRFTRHAVRSAGAWRLVRRKRGLSAGNRHFASGREFPPRRWLRRAPTPHPCGHLQCHRADRRAGKMQTRAIQSQAYFDSQSFATAVYQSALTYELRNRGYEIETGRSGAPEIKGYSQEYLDASSPRSQQIKDHLETFGRNSLGAAQIAAHATRDSKQLLSPEEVLSAHRQMAAEFGNQPQRIVAEARERARSQERKPDDQSKAQEVGSYAKASIFEH